MNFTEHPAFVFPFVVGMLFIFIYLPVIYVTWLRKNSLADFKTILRSIFTTNTLKAVRKSSVSACSTGGSSVTTSAWAICT